MCRICHVHASDPALVVAVRRGDPGAFDEIHRRYARPLERFAARMLADRPPGPEDVVQEVFARAHHVLLGDPRDLELRPWLYTAVRNRCVDELRRRTASALPAGHDLASPALEPGAVLAAREHLRDVLGAVASLPPRQRHALLQGAVAGRPVRSVADELGVSEGAVKNLTHRARAALHEQLAPAA